MSRPPCEGIYTYRRMYFEIPSGYLSRRCGAWFLHCMINTGSLDLNWRIPLQIALERGCGPRQGKHGIATVDLFLCRGEESDMITKRTLIVFPFIIFFVAVMAGCRQETSLTPLSAIEPGSSIQRYIQATDSEGQAIFEEPGSGEEIIITLSEEGQPTSGAYIAYIHGETYPYEAFFGYDSRGLIAADFFLHNSEHELEVIRGEIRPYNEEQTEALEGYVSDTGLVSRNTYIETIPESELNRRMENLSLYTDILVFFLGKFPIPGPVTAFLGEVSDYVSNIQRPYDETVTWDMYVSYDGEWGTTTFVFVQSQSPRMQSPLVRHGEDGHAYLSLLAVDPVRYPVSSARLPGLPDQTIFLGSTDNSDLTYYFDLTDEGGHLLLADQVDQASVCVQDTCTRTEVDLGVLPTGSYTLSLTARDEAGNFSDTDDFSFFFDGAARSEDVQSFSDPFEAAIFLAETVSGGNYEDLETLVGPDGVAITGYLYEWRPPGTNNGDEVIRFFAEASQAQQPRCEFMIGPFSNENYVLVFSGFDLIPEFGSYAEGLFLVADVRPHDDGNSYMAALGPFSQRDIADALSGPRLSCDGGAFTPRVPSVEEFAEQVRAGAESGSTDYLADMVYLHPISCIGYCDEPPVSPLNGFVPAVEAVEYISNCLDTLESFSEMDIMSNYGFNPEPIFGDNVLPQGPITDTEFYFEWGMDQEGGRRAYARLLLGVSLFDLGYQVTEAYCYPFGQ